MSQDPGVLNLDIMVAQRREALGATADEGDLQAFTFAGKRFLVPHPLFADDQWKEELTDCESDVEFAQHLLGDQFDEFVALGGKSAFMGLLWQEIRKQVSDEDPEGRPTRSSTSSRAQRRRQSPPSKRTTRGKDR